MVPMFPLTRGPFWYRFFEPQPCCKSVCASPSCCLACRGNPQGSKNPVKDAFFRERVHFGAFFFLTIVLSKHQIRSPWVSGGFLERSGSLERMEMEASPRAKDLCHIELLLPRLLGELSEHSQNLCSFGLNYFFGVQHHP